MPSAALSGTSGFGFFGKLPSRGDFVRDGLPRQFVACWDGWLQRVLPAPLAALGDQWPQAPAWRFHLAAGLCDAEAASGVLLPSMDAVGRYFPLTVASLRRNGPPDSLAAAENACRLAVAQAWAPAVLRGCLSGLEPGGGPAVPAGMSLWCRSGGADRGLLLLGLPDAASLTMMLTEGGDVR
ncbi:MAG: type VI secretion-associated protein [Rhodospirillales bacterium 20-64-7]|nr:MAG: type VI secretion-associated protein [Rhodospirillales bacterium 20-64-7]HQT75628.1 type VI secretion system-associated protein TagF [Rhodopila sp.]